MKLIADPRNPAQYFGACGLFELVSMRDRSLMACWDRTGLIVEELSDDAFKQTINAFAHADLVPDDDWTGEDTTRPFTLTHAASNFRIPMDWWERRDGNGNSFWKCFGGQQKSLDASKLLIACKALAGRVAPDNLFELNFQLSGRLGFDPRSAWNPIDTGFSPNDLGTSLKAVPTYVFAELLSTVAMQRWPFRPSGGTCSYHLWTQQLPLSVARARAVGGDGPAYSFSRVKRGQGISCFTYSRPLRASEENRS